MRVFKLFMNPLILLAILGLLTNYVADNRQIVTNYLAAFVPQNTKSVNAIQTNLANNPTNTAASISLDANSSYINSLLSGYGSATISKPTTDTLNSTEALNLTQLNNILLNLQSRNMSINYASLNKSYGSISQGGALPGAGQNLYYLSYSSGNARTTVYTVGIQKAFPNLTISAGGAVINRPNITVPIHVPILPNQTTYNVSINLAAALKGNNNLHFTYQIKQVDMQTGAVKVIGSSSTNATGTNLNFNLKKIPVNQSVQIAFDANGNANYTDDDPNAQVLPTPILFYIPITLTNSQSTGIPHNFQQEITVNALKYQAYEIANLINMEFFYTNGVVVPSWMEGNSLNEYQRTSLSSSNSVIYWLKLDGNFLKASTSNTLFLGFAGTTITSLNTMMDGVTVGEAPQLSITSAGNNNYNALDTGYAVFNTFYLNWNGVSLPTGWSTTNAAGDTVANQLKIAAGNVMVNSTAHGANAILESNLHITTATGGGIWWGSGKSGLVTTRWLPFTCCGTTATQNAVNGLYFGIQAGNFVGTVNAISTSSHMNVTAYSTITAPVNLVAGMGIQQASPQNAIFFLNESTAAYTTIAANIPTNTGLLITYGTKFGGLGAAFQLNWTRIRQTPPGTVMPSVSFGSVQVPLFANPNPPQVTNSVIDVGQISVVNSIITGNGIVGLTANWFWIAPNDISGSATNGNMVPFTFSNTGVSGNPSNVVLIFNALSTTQVNLEELNGGFASPNVVTNTLSGFLANNAMGTWQVNAFVIDSNGVGANTITTSQSSVTVHPALTGWSVTISNALIDQSQYQVLTYAGSGGTPNYAYNFMTVNTQVSPANIITNGNVIYTGCTLTTNTFVYQIGTDTNSIGSVTVKANVLDAASTPVNLMTTGTFTIYKALSGTSIVSSNGLADVGQTETLTYAISGGAPPYLYNFMVTNAAVTPVNIIANILPTTTCTLASNSFTFTISSSNPNAIGTLSISANVQDSATANEFAVMTNTLSANAAIALTVLYGNPSSVAQGASETIQYTVTGGQPPFSYNFIVSNTNVAPVNELANQIFTGCILDTNTFVLTMPSVTNDVGTIQIYGNIVDSATTFTGGTTNLITTNTITVTAGATCTLALSNSVIDFGTLTSGTNLAPQNAVTDTNSGTAASYLWLYGSNWIQIGAVTPNFYVTNSVFSNALSQTGTGYLYNAVTIASANSGMLVTTTTPNTLFFGINVPSGEPAVSYSSNIAIFNAC